MKDLNLEILKNTQLNTEMFVKPVYQENKDFL